MAEVLLGMAQELVRAPEPSELLVPVSCLGWLPPCSIPGMAVDGNARGWMGWARIDGTATWVALAVLASSACCHVSPLCKRRKKILSDLMGLPRES